jgi:antitoxin PrlF
MEKVKVTRNFQVTIPASVRKQVDIRVGTTLIAEVVEGRIIFEKRSGDVTKLKLKLGKRFDWRDVEKAARDAAVSSDA